MDVLCVLQARMSSTRLPGKVLMRILGEPMLARQLERLRRARRIDALCVATSDQPGDDPIAQLCARLGAECFRGSLDDVLDRYYRAAQRHMPRHVLRVTGDCPLVDPELLDALVDLHVKGGYDYSSNVHERSYPKGLDAEIFRFAVLEEAWRVARTPEEREHVTPYMYRTGPAFRRGLLKDSTDRSRLRWTVDYPADFAFVSRVYDALYPLNPAFTTADVHALLHRQPEIAALNAPHASA